MGGGERLMKQVAQRARDGHTSVHEVPPPALRPGHLLVANRFSLISAGTERGKLEFAGKNALQKARARPDLVAKLVQRARTEGVRGAIGAARERLDALSPLGYSSAGVVVGVGAGVEGFAPGDLVACAGGGFANHAELVAVPRNLVAKVPDGVPLDAAAYATVGAIALHAVRQAEASLGERVGVIGLGLVGQLAVRILLAAGCDAIAIDLDPAGVELAAAAGARAFERGDPALAPAVLAATGGLGLDAVLICAATRSSDPMDLAVSLARDRGRLVVVGDVPVTADRRLMYEKELELRLSRSYGPGRYDRDYELHGHDLPAGYVRWTEQRNLQAFLELVAGGRLDPAPLTTHRFPVDLAEEAYAVLGDEEPERRPFGILLEFDEAAVTRPRAALVTARRPHTGALGVGVIGAGSFTRRVLLPALGGAKLVAIASESGLSAADAASRFGFARAASSAEEILADESIGAVVIATRHSTHAALAAAALRAGKAVFVEKPLALNEEELLDVEDALRSALPRGGLLMVGFNRRFAPLAERLRTELAGLPERVLHARVNAGPLDHDHWLNDPAEGGRLLGEGCHFVDLLAHLAGSPVTSVHATTAGADGVAATLRLADGTVANLLYAGNGDPRLPKERIEAFAGGMSAVLDDFRRLEVYRNGRRSVVKGGQDKGHRAQVARFLDAAAWKAEPPSVESYLASTRATLALVDSLRAGVPVEVA
jgi:predicted dehydrogenase